MIRTSKHRIGKWKTRKYKTGKYKLLFILERVASIIILVASKCNIEILILKI